MDARTSEQLESILKRILQDLDEPTLWGWNARPNGAFLVISDQDAQTVLEIMNELFEQKWSAENLDQIDSETQQIVDYLSGIRERQVLFTLRPEEKFILYGAFWPWATSSRVSVRISVFAPGQGELSLDETQLLLNATLSANNSVKKA